MNPKRVQRKRTAGWKMPENTVYVGRPTEWGNPFTIKRVDSSDPWKFAVYSLNGNCRGRYTKIEYAKLRAVQLFQWEVEDTLKASPDFLKPLAGKNLACWCRLDHPCHCDVLLELANGGLFVPEIERYSNEFREIIGTEETSRK